LPHFIQTRPTAVAYNDAHTEKMTSSSSVNTILEGKCHVGEQQD
jgi:hypothetical protein